MNLEFLEATHTYKLDGNEIPSVTRAIDFSGLVDYDNVRDSILERRTMQGREVHRAVHFHVQNDLDEPSLTPDVAKYLASFKLLEQQWRFKPLYVEREFVGELGGMLYGMKPDLVGVVLGHDAVVDVKTGKSYPWHGVQMSGYAAGLPRQGLTSAWAKFFSWDRYTVHLQKDGSIPKVKQWNTDASSIKELQLFEACLRVTYAKMSWGQKFNQIDFTF